MKNDHLNYSLPTEVSNHIKKMIDVIDKNPSQYLRLGLEFNEILNNNPSLTMSLNANKMADAYHSTTHAYIPELLQYSDMEYQQANQEYMNTVLEDVTDIVTSKQKKHGLNYSLPAEVSDKIKEMIEIRSDDDAYIQYAYQVNDFKAMLENNPKLTESLNTDKMSDAFNEETPNWIPAWIPELLNDHPSEYNIKNHQYSLYVVEHATKLVKFTQKEKSQSLNYSLPTEVSNPIKKMIEIDIDRYPGGYILQGIEFREMLDKNPSLTQSLNTDKMFEAYNSPTHDGIPELLNYSDSEYEMANHDRMNSVLENVTDMVKSVQKEQTRNVEITADDLLGLETPTNERQM